MQAACTASLRLAALGSHQNMWQVKSWGPSAMMKAKVWTSFPTPMKDRKRTLHSDSTSSLCNKKNVQNVHLLKVLSISLWHFKASKHLWSYTCRSYTRCSSETIAGDVKITMSPPWVHVMFSLLSHYLSWKYCKSGWSDIHRDGSPVIPIFAIHRCLQRVIDYIHTCKMKTTHTWKYINLRLSTAKLSQ